MDRGAWWATVHGIAKSQTQLSNFTFTFLHWRRKWQSTPVFLPGESQGWGSLVGCHLQGHTESNTTEATLQQQHFFSCILLCTKNISRFFLLKKTISIYLDIIGSIVCVGLNGIIHFIFSSCGFCWGSSTRAGRYEMASLKYLLCYLAYLEHLGGPFLSFCYFLTCRIFLSKHYHSLKQCHWNS